MSSLFLGLRLAVVPRIRLLLHRLFELLRNLLCFFGVDILVLVFVLCLLRASFPRSLGAGFFDRLIFFLDLSSLVGFCVSSFLAADVWNCLTEKKLNVRGIR